MKMKALLIIVCCVALLVDVCRGQDETAAEKSKPNKSIFDKVVKQLETRYYDKEFVESQLPKIVERYRPLAEKAESIEQQRQVTFEFLSRIPASHLGLFSKSGYDRLIGELFNKVAPTLGLELIEVGDQYFAHNVLEGGPAAKAGIRIGDRVLSIDKKPVKRNSRVDFRTDDAYVPDPAVHSLHCQKDEMVAFEIDRGWGKVESVDVKVVAYSAFEAAKASVQIFEHEGKKIGYIHFWFIHIQGVNKLLKETLENRFKECDSLILDLRGRGGNAMAVQPMVDILSGKKSSWKKPNVALVDNYSRSAKEVIAYLLKKDKVARIVGQRTAGAVIPATFVNVGDETVLMFPTFKLQKFTDVLEGNGVLPDVMVQTWKPYPGKQDPILSAGLKESVRLIKQQISAADEGAEPKSKRSLKSK